MTARQSSGLWVLAGSLAPVFASCAATSHVNVRQIPGFCLQPPTLKDTMHGAGEARMFTLNLSRTAALGRARDDIEGAAFSEFKVPEALKQLDQQLQNKPPKAGTQSQ